MIRYFPTDDDPFKHINDKGGVNLACFSLDIGKVSDLRSTAPQESFLIRGICDKVAFDQIIGTLLSWSLFGGNFAFAPPYALYA